VPGGVYVWPLPEGATDITFQGNAVMRLANTALVGIPISHATGVTSLGYRTGGTNQTHEFDIVDKVYSEQRLTIANKAMVNPSEESLQRIRTEAQRQRKLYKSFSAPKDLSRGFDWPLIGVTTSLFGHRRFFNDEPRSPHSGLDIAGDTGTPVRAAGNAVVTLADDLYFNGNTLFLDHGQGLITMYCHLSELLVQPGDSVEQGDTIGLVGATGRVTGPHLHWSVSLNGNRIDPESFMQALNTQVNRTASEG
jgi:murein DD-endopeptidase MepM/ murein hydrolase activator NlpD